MDKKSSVWINTECWSFWQAKCWTWKEKETTIINSVISNHVNYICILVALNAPNNHIHSRIKEWLTDLRLKSQSTIMKMSAVRNWQRCVLWNKPQFNISTRKQKRRKKTEKMILFVDCLCAIRTVAHIFCIWNAFLFPSLSGSFRLINFSDRLHMTRMDTNTKWNTKKNDEWKKERMEMNKKKDWTKRSKEWSCAIRFDTMFVYHRMNASQCTLHLFVWLVQQRTMPTEV